MELCVLCVAARPVGVGQLDDRQLPARGIVHAQSPCFCTAAITPRCYCMSNFTYIQTSSLSPAIRQLNALASSARLPTRAYTHILSTVKPGFHSNAIACVACVA